MPQYMIQTGGVLCEHNIQIDPPRVVVIPAGGVVVLIADQTQSERPQPRGELAQRLVQNIGAGDLYLAFGIGQSDAELGTVNATNCHCYIASGLQRDISSDRLRVVGYSVAGTTVATEVRWRVTNMAGVETLSAPL